jgi:hypothetical protein
VFGNETDIRFIENHHLWRKQEYRVVIDFSMCIETPAKTGMNNSNARHR